MRRPDGPQTANPGTANPETAPATGAAEFDDILRANDQYAATFRLAGLEPRATRGLALLTCIDSRIEPLQMAGLEPGDAKILRNAGARVTDDVLRSLVAAVHFLGVVRVCIVQHTRCRLYGSTNTELRTEIGAAAGADASAWDFLPIDDHERVLRADVERITSCPLIPPTIAVGAFVYDVDTGRLRPVAT
jgi:carbonic anhydrase